MLARRVAAALVVLALSAGFAGASGPDHELEVVWNDHYELLRNKLPVWGRESLQKQIDDLFGDIGVRVRWLTEVGGEERTATAVRIVLIPLSGEGWGLPPSVMGAVMDKRVTSRTLYVFFPGVLRNIGDKTGAKSVLRDPRRVRDLARALARVVAHEIVHALDPGLPHSATEGIMSAALKPEMLRRDVLGFSASTAARVVAALASTPRVGPSTAAYFSNLK